MQATKTRARKSTASKTKLQSQNVITTCSTKYTGLIKDNTMTEETLPAKVRPTKTNLTYVDYIEDFKVRMQIHNFEVDELVKDLKSGINLLNQSSIMLLIISSNLIRKRLVPLIIPLKLKRKHYSKTVEEVST